MTFRSILIILVSGLILGSTIITSLFMVNGMRQAMRTLMEKQVATTLDAVTGLVEEHFEPSERLLGAVSRSIELGRIKIDDPTVLALEFLEELRFEQGISWVSFGYADGRFAGARAKGGQFFINISAPDSGPPSEWLVDDQNRLAPYESQDRPAAFDSRLRPWFRKALEGDGPQWTRPYDFASGGRGITVATAIRKPNGELLGVMTVDFLLTDIAEYLEKLTGEFRGEPLVFSLDGIVLASPQASVSSPIVDALREHVRSGDFHSDDHPKGTLIMEIPFQDEVYFVAARTARIPGGLDCVSTILFRRSQIFAAVDTTLRTATLAAVSVLAISLVVGFLLSRRVTTSLSAITSEVARVGSFDLEPNPLPSSSIREIHVLTDSVERMRSSLKSFAHYVPVDLVRDLVRSGGVAALGGERREIAIMFCDLAGFTGFAERQSPESAVQTLTTYFEEFGAAIDAEGGVIDKFLGDGIMALFNAPERIPSPAHSASLAALRACRTLDLKKRADGGNFSVRVGLHFGEGLVGNVGTSVRFSYTAIGDVVNLCSRLEGLNKIYGTRILASQAFVSQTGEDFVWRPLDRVAVAGRSEPLAIYQLLCARSEATPETLRLALLARDAVNAFFDRHWDIARACLDEIGDQAAQVLIDRIPTSDLPASPSWDGVLRLNEK
ncbi:MAG: adenylate/guanylate cyclase domain-containing protein [Terrimicrobiaceae bacterium]